MKKPFILVCVILLCFCLQVKAQKNSVHWISFEQLEYYLTVKPKKVFISLYTDWCVYCKKMDKVTFKNSKVISLLNNNYYAVKMNAESVDTIIFDGKRFTNKRINESRKPIHEIPLLLASRKNSPFSLPANLILNKNFTIKERYFEYLSPEKMKDILTNK